MEDGREQSITRLSRIFQGHQPFIILQVGCLSSRLVRLWHPASDGHARILAASLGLLLLLLEILVVSHLLLLFVCHIARLKSTGARDIRLRSIHVAVRDVFGRLCRNISSVDAILRRRFGCVETRLRDVSETEPGKFCQVKRVPG